MPRPRKNDYDDQEPLSLAEEIACQKYQQWQFFEQYSHEPFIATSRFIIQYLGTPPERAAVATSKHTYTIEPTLTANEILLEMAWTHFYLGDSRKTLGLLIALVAVVLIGLGARQLFKPEGMGDYGHYRGADIAVLGPHIAGGRRLGGVDLSRLGPYGKQGHVPAGEIEIEARQVLRRHGGDVDDGPNGLVRPIREIEVVVDNVVAAVAETRVVRIADSGITMVEGDRCRRRGRPGRAGAPRGAFGQGDRPVCPPRHRPDGESHPTEPSVPRGRAGEVRRDAAGQAALPRRGPRRCAGHAAGDDPGGG